MIDIQENFESMLMCMLSTLNLLMVHQQNIEDNEQVHWWPGFKPCFCAWPELDGYWNASAHSMPKDRIVSTDNLRLIFPLDRNISCSRVKRIFAFLIVIMKSNRNCWYIPTTFAIQMIYCREHIKQTFNVSSVKPCWHRIYILPTEFMSNHLYMLDWSSAMDTEYLCKRFGVAWGKIDQNQ